MTDSIHASASRDQRLQSILYAYLQALDRGEQPDRQALLAAHPELRAELAAYFADEGKLQQLAQALATQHFTPPDKAITLDSMSNAPATGGPPRIRYFGDYELLEEIARGGMGVVFKARQVSLNRIVALKMILKGELATAADVQRFRQEAEAAANLDHPNIVPIYEIGEHEGQQYFSMKLIGPGKRRKDLGIREAVRAVTLVAQAVHHAHQHGILHRDLKPSNVLFDETGKPCVGDFGLAKSIEGDSGITHSGVIVGTPSYMAPEQARAEKGLTTAVDVYSLGAILYEWLTNRPPFHGADALATLLMVLTDEPVSPRSLNARIDRDLETICLRCLEKRAQQRYQSAAALADDLQRWSAGEPIASRPVGLAEKTMKWVRRRPVIAGLLAAVLLVFILGVAAFAWSFDQTLQARDDALAEQRKTDQARQNAIAEQQKTALALHETQQANKLANEARNQKEQQLVRAEGLLYNLQYRTAHDFFLNHDLLKCRAMLDECRPDFRGPEHGYLTNQLQKTMRTLRGHNDQIASLALSTDGKRLCSGSFGKVIKVWNLDNGKETATLHGHDQGVSCLVLSADGKQLFSGSWDNTIKVWNLDTGKETATLRGHTRGVSCLALSADGKRLFSGSHDSTIKEWEVASGKATRTLPGHTAAVTCLALSLDGKRLCSGSYDSTIKVWDTDAGKELKTLRGHTHFVQRLALSPTAGDKGGQRLFSGSTDKSIKVWDLETGKEIHTLHGHADGITGLALSPLAGDREGKRLISASYDHTIKEWDLESGKETLTLRGHVRSITALAVSPLADGHEGKRLFCSGSSDGTISVWDLETGKETRTLRGHKGGVTSLVLARDKGGQRLYSASWDRTIQVWDPETGKATSLRGHTDMITSLAVSPAAANVPRRCYSGSRGDFIKVWDLETGEEVLTLRGHAGLVNCLALSKDGRRLCSGGYDRIAKVWDLETGKEILSLPSNNTAVLSKGITSLALSTDGKRLCAGDYDTIQVWDLETGQEILILRGHKDQVRSLGLSVDGKRLFSGSMDQTIKVWDLETGKETLTLRGHRGGITSLALSRDGKRLFSGGGGGFVNAEPIVDGAIKLWDLDTGKEILTLLGHTGEVTSLALSDAASDRGGNRLFSGSRDGTIKVWELEPSTGH